MKIEYDRYYNKSVVWLIEESGRFELFRGTKKECENFKKKRRK